MACITYCNLFTSMHIVIKMADIVEHVDTVEIVNSGSESENEVEASGNKNLQPLEGATSIILVMMLTKIAGFWFLMKGNILN